MKSKTPNADARLLQAAEKFEVKRLIMCDVGCGVFQNDPNLVGECFARAIYETRLESVQEIVLTGKKEFINSVQETHRDLLVAG